MRQREKTRDSISRAMTVKKDKNNSDRESRFVCVFVSGVGFRPIAFD